ncbi:MAG: NADH-quinone oxidoreductase subunit N [Desulfonauticus sp.]|nr:NADH-quinone oxidoreductase subunit N [Desulfonauticus sp.]
MIKNMYLFLPEIYLIFLVIVLFFQTLSKKNLSTQWLSYALFIGLGVCFYSLPAKGLLFFNTYKIDRLSQFFKLLTYLGLTICVLNAKKNPQLTASVKKSDYYLFMCLSSLGILFLSSSIEIFTIYIALELTSYSLYILVPLRSNSPKAVEAAIKYMLYGAVATALGLYGVSYILAVHHTTFLTTLATQNWNFTASTLSIIGLGLFLLSFLYKLSLFPFHFWSPDLYEGTSNETATFAAVMPKIGAVIVLIRLVSFVPCVELKTILAIFAACSMTYGNILALVQKDVKRLLGYSTISHAGYMVMGLVVGTTQGLGSVAFYVFAYVLMNLAIFWVITHLGQDGNNVSIEDLQGLYQRAPIFAFVLAVAAFGLAGIPPTIGFTGKFFLLTSLWGHGFNWLVIIAALNTGIAIFYYLNLVRFAYTKEPTEQELATDFNSNLVAFSLSVGILVIGLLPQNIVQFLINSVSQLKP